jgi:hypothetical protein
MMIFTLVLVITTGVILWFTPSNEDFRADNPSWNGGRELSDFVPITPLASLSELTPSPRGVTLIVIPYRQFDTAELEVLSNFVVGGGVLLLADDYGWGNQVLQHLGLGARFSGQALLDPLHCYKNKWFPLVNCSQDEPLTMGMEHLTLNHATVILDVAPDGVLASSSSFSFLDSNGNQVADETEPTGPLPVMSREVLGDGQVILLADPSVFINGMLDFGESKKLLENIAAASPSGLFLDQSHLETSNLRQTKDWMHAVRGMALTAPGALALVMVVLAIMLAPVWHREKD